ncbi:MAG: DegT/DnrJ/EryC1/StrS family aminotransferase [Flavobacteriales bacterium]|nr:DegT/DnrJ/EryC1/StrS family aminotransferase [Flavobacteriales bacterium]
MHSTEASTALTEQSDPPKGPLQITRIFLPPLEEVNAAMAGIWERGWVTNNGPLVRELEQRLGDYLGTGAPSYVGNGTLALQLAIRALDLRGEVITTPFSFVATTSALVWERCQPVFADIQPDTFNIDPDRIESLIGPKTTAILATHVYGNPCDIDRIEAIARKHDLKVVYDGAHGFGTIYKGASLLSYGDITVASFHATKLFHSIEGGGLFCKDPQVKATVDRMRNFGHNGPDQFLGVGINAKNSEFHAAIGLLVLRRIEEVLAERRAKYKAYSDELASTGLRFLRVTQGTDVFNGAYFPVVFHDEAQLKRAVHALTSNGIHPRRYFYPSLDTLHYIGGRDVPVAHDISARVLCLPLYYGLEPADIQRTCAILRQAL